MSPSGSSSTTSAAPGSTPSGERDALRRDSWGGHAIVLFLVGALGYPVASRLIDGAYIVSDSMGRTTVVDGGRADTIVGLGFFAAAVCAAGVACLARNRLPWGSGTSFALQLLVLWWAVLSIVIPRTPSLAAGDLAILGTIPLILGVVSSPPTLVTARRVNLIRDAFATGQFLYPFFAPEIARVECRPDKCGIFGFLDTGFFTQENTGIAAISLLLPLMAVSSTKRMAYSSGIALAVALASGSRTGIVSVIVATALSLYLRRRIDADGSRIRLSPLFVMLPLAATVVSLALFLFADPAALTGRGAVYAANRAALQGPAFWYGVPWDTVLRASDGYLISDHGEASHIVARAGVVGLCLWLVALVRPLWRRRFTPEEALGVTILVGGAARMLTESTFELEARTVGFGALLLVAGLCARSSERQDASSTRRADPRQLAGAGAAAALTFAVLPMVLPSVYTARNVLMCTVPVADATSGEAGQIARGHVAATVEALGGSGALSGETQTVLDLPAPGDSSTSLSRNPNATALRLTTSGSNTDAVRSTNDSIATALADAFSTPADGDPGATIEVQPAGSSLVVEENPWKAHLVPGAAAAALVAGLTAFALRRRRA